MPTFRKLAIRKPSRYVIVDGQHWPQDKEYVDLGMRQGWLRLDKIITDRYGETEYQYRYPNTYTCE